MNNKETMQDYLDGELYNNLEVWLNETELNFWWKEHSVIPTMVSPEDLFAFRHKFYAQLKLEAEEWLHENQVDEE